MTNEQWTITNYQLPITNEQWTMSNEQLEMDKVQLPIPTSQKNLRIDH